MNLLVSTNVYKPGQLARVIPHLHAFRGQIGVELFPMFDADCYEEELLHCLPEFEGIPVSFHGPYYETEHSAAPGTPEYAHSMDLIRQTLPYCVRLQSQYLVFHHNNIPVTEERREEMIRVSRENYREIAELFKPHQIPVVVENAGVLDRGNMLFDQDAFIQLCREEHYPVLIDIGHAYANGWDLEQTMEALKDQIVAYHLHNNDGVHDSHQRIFHGTLDFPLFLSDYQRLTPNADLVLEYSPNVADDESGIQEDISWLLEQIRRELMLSEKKLFLFDIDGTVALGDVLLPGAAEFFQEIKERGGQFVFITNNSTKSIADYIKKFRQMGVSTDPQNFVTASTASASWLRQHAAGKTIYTLGTRSLIRELEGHGIRVTTDPDTQDISFVLVAYDSELTYKKLTDTCRILQTRPVTFLATNPDLVCPVPFGYVPDCGSICQMITNATGQVPHYIGKPSTDMVDIALRENPFSKEETVIVGDRFYTDIACGNASGVETVLVLTGEAKKTDTMIHTYSPTYIFDSIKEVKKAWKN